MKILLATAFSVVISLSGAVYAQETGATQPDALGTDDDPGGGDADDSPSTPDDERRREKNGGDERIVHCESGLAGDEEDL